MQVIKDPSDPTGAMYIQPTGAPRALVIERDIVVARGTLYVLRGPLVPASLVSAQLRARCMFIDAELQLCVLGAVHASD